MNDLTRPEGKQIYWWIPLISGVFLLLFGLWFLLAPMDSFQTLTIIFGIIIFLSGVFEIYIVLKDKGFALEFLSYIWGGILSILLGGVLIMNPQMILIIVSVLIGFWLIFKGGEIIKRALALRKAKNEKWKNHMFLGVALIIVAIILLWHPEIIGFTIAMWTSIAFIILGIFRIYLAFRIKSV